MTDSLKLVTKAFAWMALAAACFRASAELPPEDIYDAVLPSVMTLEVENATGERFIATAFLAIKEGFAVTAWHVVHDAVRVTGFFADGERVRISGFVDKDVENDLALLKLETPTKASRSLTKLSSTKPRIGSRVYVMGAPKGFDFSIADGLISQIRYVDGVRYYQVSCPISPGDSGGPVLNSNGEVIGVMSWRKANAQALSFAIPGQALSRLEPSRAPAAWRSRTALTGFDARWPRGSDGRVRTEASSAPPPAGATFADFQKLLQSKAGQQLTVTVQDEGGEKKFTFQVPPEEAR